MTQATHNVEAVHPVTPMQEGMLFHALSDPGAGLYLRQSTWSLGDDLDPARLRQAWNRVIARHPALRSTFVWKGFDRPLQVARRQAEPAWGEEDWRAVPKEELRSRLEGLLRADRQRGFDLERGPLLRFTLIRLDDGFRLVWTYLQLLLDGWSRGLVLDEVMGTYAGLLTGVEPDAPAVRPFQEYAEWLDRRDREADLSFWRRHLAGFTDPAPLPFEHAGESDPKSGTDQRVERLSEERTAALEEACRRNGLTLNTAVLGAWAILVSRATGHRDLVLGVTDSGRPPELEGADAMVGLFINTLPLRLRVGDGQPLAAWLRALQETQAEVREHGHVPLVDIQAASQVPASTTLFDAIYVFENYPVVAGTDGGAPVRIVQSYTRTHYPLNLLVTPGARLGLACRYDPSRLSSAGVRRVLHHLKTLLAALPEHLDREVDEWPWLSDADCRRQLAVADGGPAAVEVPTAPRSLGALVRAQARSTPRGVAVRWDGGGMTYAELDLASDRLAVHLRRTADGDGNLSEERVGVSLPGDGDLAVAILGVVKSGAAWVPLEPGHPTARLEELVRDAGVRRVVTRSGVAGAGGLPGVLRIDLDAPWEGEVRGEAPAAEVLEEDRLIAYVIYTSGSTGRPKGVAVSHRAVLNRLLWAQNAYPLAADDVVLQSAAAGFDFSVWELFAPWLAGAAVYLVPAAHRDPESLARRLGGGEVTTAHFVPSVLRTVLELAPERAVGGQCRLRRLFCGGETLDPELRNRALARWPGVELYNQYGPTEATIDATWHLCAAGRPVGEVPIGRPIAGLRAHVLDTRLRPLPAGVRGELYLAGAGLARGYLGRPGATAESFLPDPLAGEPGHRMYRTGDLARWRDDGELTFAGRRDDQVQVHGVRIEPGEVEAALRDDDDVADVAVVARGEREGRRLIAFVVPRSTTVVDRELPRRLRRDLSRRLPDFLVPATVIPVDTLPRTPAGKLDRRALPDPGASSVAPSRPPRGPLEELIATAWQELLGRDDFGAEDDFFTLGGHSLLAVRVISRLHRDLGVDLALQRLFEAPTVAALALEVEAALADAPRAPAPPLDRADRSVPLPLSFSQERLWFLDRLEPGSPVYNLPSAVALEGELDVAALAGALAGVVTRHEVLRTHYTSPVGDGGGPRQLVSAPAPPARLPQTDLSRLPASAAEGEAVRLRRKEARRPFDLTTGPVLRALVVRLAPRHHHLLVTVHHVATDAWSMGLLTAEVSALYSASVTGEAPDLPPVKLQFGDFAVWQRESLRGERLEAELEHWRRRLKGAPPVLELPTDRPRPPVQSYRGRALPVRVGESLSQRLSAFARKAGATPFMVLLAAFQILLGRFAGSRDVLVGTPVAGRRRVELEQLIGFFANTLVLRLGLRAEAGVGACGFGSALGRVRQATLDALAHQDLPFDRLVKDLAPDRSLAHPPIFQVMFALQNAPVEEASLPGLELRPLRPTTGGAKFDLFLSLSEGSEGFSGTLTYASALFDPTTVRRLAEAYQHLLHGVLEQPRRDVEELDLLGAGRRQQILYEWSGTERAAAAPPSASLWRRFAEQADVAGSRPALTWGTGTGPGEGWDERTLTYAELHRRATRFAAHLVDLGVGPEDRVGILLQRGPDLVVALLGVLAAGGAYVPLDPQYPRRRRRLTLADASVSVLVAEADGDAELWDDGADAHHLVLSRDGLPGRDPEPSHRAAFRRAGGGNLAYVIYTSGSTGRPKGVAIEHRSAVAMVDWAARAFSPRDLAVTLAATSICFDLSVFELFVPLLQGHRVVLLRDALELAEFSARGNEPPPVTLVNTVPTAMTEVLRVGALPASVGTVNLAGEPLRSSLAEDLHRLDGVESVRNLYGPSEDTTYSTWCRVHPGGGEPTIGRPVTGTFAYVADDSLRLQPVAVPGELLLGGRKLARGYLERPALTAERWIPDPFSRTSGGRLYRTGDRVRWLADGQLEFLGRFDHQVKVRGFRIELDEIGAVLKRHPAVRESVVVVVPGPSGVRRLVAYVAADAREAELRQHLGRNLPDYMVPSAWVFLDALPLTPNGKIDRAALPDPQAAGHDPRHRVAPRDAREAALVEVWSEVLGIDAPGVHDDFFRAGGDSILSIQVVARARQCGLALTPRQVFQHPTIAGMAAVAEETGAPVAEQAPLVGQVPLLPVQKRFLDGDPVDPHHYNQSVLLAVHRSPNLGALAGALGHLHTHHDALRARFARTSEGWGQRLVAPGGTPPFHHVDLTALPREARPRAAAVAASATQRSLDLGRGPMTRAIWLDGVRDEGAQGHLLLVHHHLVVDGVSWRVLLDDLARAYAALEAGGEAELPAKTTSVGEWARGLRRWALQGGEGETRWWIDTLADAPPPLPRDFAAGPDLRSRVDTVVVRFDEAETSELVRLLAEAYRCGLEEALLTALTRAFAAWTGEDRLLVDLEGHGREEEMVGGSDLSRTVGWLTSIHPVLLSASPGSGPGEALRRVKHSLRSVPSRGVGYGALVTWGQGPAATLATAPRPQLIFNYLGQLDRALPENAAFTAARGPRGSNVSPRALRDHPFDVTSRVAGGRLAVSWRYGRGRYQRATVERLAATFEAELRRILEHCRDTGNAGYTPSDFPLAGLDMERLAQLFSGDRGIEDVYPLAPVQEGLLTHAVASPAAYVEQRTQPLSGHLDADALAASWQRLSERHTALRTAFLWQDVETPLQLVRRDARLRLRRVDSTSVAPGDRQHHLRRLAEEDRNRGFDLSRPPLVRVTLVELGGDRYHLIWTSHHLVTDGWSVAILVRELLTLYDGLLHGREAALPAARPYADHIAWLEARDAADDEAYWRRLLGDVEAPTPLPTAPPGEVVGEEATANLRAVLPPAETAGLARLARNARVTLGSVVQAAWALLLARYSGHRDVVFGVTVSGRPADLPGVEGIVGPFINTVPARLEVPAGGGLGDWLREVQEAASRRGLHEHGSLVQRWSGVPLAWPLFETLFVFQNFPGRDGAGGADEAPTRTDADGGDDTTVTLGAAEYTLRTRYPLTLVVGPGRSLRLRLAYDRLRLSTDEAQRFLDRFLGLLRAFAADPSPALAELTRFPGESTPDWGPPDLGAVLPATVAPGLEDSTPFASPRQPELLGEDGRPVLTGLPGEICLRLAKPPKGGLPAGWGIERVKGAVERPIRVRTGRWARQTADGSLRDLGPADARVRIHGRRVHLRDVEAVLERHAAVRQCAVTVADDGGSGLTCWVLPEDPVPEPGDLEAFATARLPAHLRPRRWVVDRALPRDGDGALSRRRLDAREPIRDSGGPELEELVMGVWRDILGTDQVGPDDDFLALGGNSLLATRLADRMRRVLRVDVPLRSLFETPTVASLLPRLRASLGAPAQTPPLVPGEAGESVLSYAQQRLWFHEQLHPGEAVYNVPVALSLRGPLRPHALAQALREVVRRHRVLRSTFLLRGDTPVQRIGTTPPPRLPRVDLRHLAPEKRGRIVRQLAGAQARRPFDLTTGPLLETVLLTEAAEVHDLFVTIHHIAADGWSLGLMVREVATLYQAYASGEPSPLPELPIQYSDYARWQREWLQGEVLEAELEHWRRRLAGPLASLQLPWDRPRPAASRTGSQRTWRLPAELSRRLAELARRSAATDFMVLLAGFCTLLYHLGNREEVVVGMPIANRQQKETTDLVGCFINILPLRIRLDGPPSVGQLVERVRSAALDALAHQELPLDRLVEELPRREGESGPPFEVTFGLQNTPGEAFSVPSLKVERIEQSRQTARFDLTVWATRTSEGFRLSWTWARDLFDPSTIEGMHDRLSRLLAAMVTDPEREIDRLDLSPTGAAPPSLNLKRRKLLSTRPARVRVEKGSGEDGADTTDPGSSFDPIHNAKRKTT